MYKLAATVLFAAVATALPAAAQTMGHDHASMMKATPAAQPARPAAPAEGEVRKVDKAKGTVVLKHGPLDAIGMPPMTMEFVARNPAQLADLKPGDKVRFTPEQGKDGTLIATAIERVKG